MAAFLLALLSGVLFGLSLPPFDISWLAWVAIAPVLVAAQDRRPLERIGIGLLAGVVAGFLHVGLHGDTSAKAYGYMPYLWVATLLAGACAVSAPARRLWQGLPWVFFVACAGVTFEWLTLFSPLPITIALTQHRSIPLLQIASLTGMWGISFLLWLVNAALADAYFAKRLRFLSVGIPVALVLCALVYGRTVLSTAFHGPTVRVAAVQDHNPEETQDFVPAPAVDNTPDREELTKFAVSKGARLAVWSEGCLGSAFVPGASINPSEALARNLGISLVVGYQDDALPKAHNSAAIVGPNGHTLGVYHKIHLFGGERQSIQPGTTATPFQTAVGKMGMEICFDTCYPDITRRLARSGAQIVAIPNFDPLTYGGDLHGLHAAVLAMRAAEDRVAFVRSDPNGHSEVVGPDGRVRADEPMWQAGVAVADVQLGDGKATFYARYGDWLAYLCVAGLIYGGIAIRRRRRKGDGYTPPQADSESVEAQPVVSSRS